MNHGKNSGTNDQFYSNCVRRTDYEITQILNFQKPKTMEKNLALLFPARTTDANPVNRIKSIFCKKIESEILKGSIEHRLNLRATEKKLFQ